MLPKDWCRQRPVQFGRVFIEPMLKNLKRLKKTYIFIIIFLFIVFILSRGIVFGKNELEYGITFSKKQAVELGLDWKRAFQASINELGVKNFRLSAYWDEVEPAEGEFAWTDLDWQIDTATEGGANIILAVGGRLPRWPECHFPDWAEDLSKEKREAKILEYIEKAIKRYRDNQNIIAWQVENEPFLSHFGDCPKLDS